MPEPLSYYDLKYCKVCHSLFAALGENWHETSNTTWYLEVRCGECGTWRCGEWRDDDASRWEDSVYADGNTIIAIEVKYQDRARFKHEAETLIKALDLDLLSADDFRN
jgi:hypothetical protein